MDMHCFPNVGDIMSRKGGELVVLLHVGITVLVEGIVLAVITIEQVLEGCDDVIVHGLNLVPPPKNGCGEYARCSDRSACWQISLHAAICLRQRTMYGGWPTPSSS